MKFITIILSIHQSTKKKQNTDVAYTMLVSLFVTLFWRKRRFRIPVRPNMRK